MSLPLRSLIRQTAERALVASGVATRALKRNRDRIAILAYHNVVPSRLTGLGDLSLHLCLDDFRRQLDWLTSTHDVISLDDLIQEAPSASVAPSRPSETDASSAAPFGSAGIGPRPRAAITFDDGYRGVLRYAIPELVHRRIPATVFVCPGLLGTEGFWWDRIAEPGIGVRSGDRARLLIEAGGRQERILRETPGRPMPEELGAVGPAELAEMAAQPGVTIASHTWGHANLMALPEEDLLRELLRAKEWLSAELPAVASQHLSFPYGLWNDGVRGAAASAGYRFLYRVEGGRAEPPGEGGPVVLPRVNVPAGVSLRGFELRVAGVLG